MKTLRILASAIVHAVSVAARVGVRMTSAKAKDWQDIVISESDSLIRFLESRVRQKELAEDLFQEAFLKALQTSHGPESEERVRAWFFRIMKNTIIDSYRKRSSDQKKRHRFANEADLHLALDDELDELACRCEGMLLDRLQSKYGDILRRVDLGGEKLADYAASEGITESNARVRRHRARASLKNAILSICRCLVDRQAECNCNSSDLVDDIEIKK